MKTPFRGISPTLGTQEGPPEKKLIFKLRFTGKVGLGKVKAKWFNSELFFERGQIYMQ